MTAVTKAAMKQKELATLSTTDYYSNNNSSDTSSIRSKTARKHKQPQRENGSRLKIIFVPLKV